VHRVIVTDFPRFFRLEEFTQMTYCSSHPRFKSSSWFIGSLLLGIGVLLAAGGQPVQAQTNSSTPQPLQDLQTKDSADLFNGRGNGQGSSMMNFIQNAIIGAPKDANEFASEQQESLDAETARFRAKQAEQLRLQRSQTPALTPAPAVTAPTTN
jgi:hypothetical protein